MNITIKYNDIINRCEMLSAFEAKDKFDANGQSRFLEIHINEVDKQLIQQYIIQAKNILEERMERMIVNTEDVPLTSYPYEYIDGDGATLGNYQRDDTTFETKPVGRIVLVAGWDKFALAVQTGSSTYTCYTDVSAVGEEYIYEKGKTKLYHRTPNDGKLYTWNTSGNGIVEYEQEQAPNDAFALTINDDKRWKTNNTFSRHITEALVSYAMAQWLRDKLDDRVSFYENLFNNSLNMAIKNIFTKQAPSYVS